MTDEELMMRAIRAAYSGDPSPNPKVGCLIVKDGRVVAGSHHQVAGEKHAEILALEQAGNDAEGSTVYVTLEPCNHHGKTPPCIDALLKAKVARVVIACRDPNPHVEGGGVERMRAAGIEVEIGVCEKAGQELIEPWARFITAGTSFLALKLALSLDGRIASRTGKSKWITGAESRIFGHTLRARHDAVMVGINTVLADDPRLTVRAVAGRNPIRVIVDSKLRLPGSSRLVQSAATSPTCVITTVAATAPAALNLEEHGVNLIHVPATAEGRCDMRVALRELAKREVVSVLCEGGAELAGTLLASQQVDRLHAFLAPILLGPRGRPGAVDWAGPENPDGAPRLADPHWELHGNDAYVTGRVRYPESA
jgi:diaminohydroxyphosphoribosylaminopyrimidine deaminase / 5-amino-6-(5-phosphoribosylamino)uracil reductase